MGVGVTLSYLARLRSAQRRPRLFRRPGLFFRERHKQAHHFFHIFLSALPCPPAESFISLGEYSRVLKPKVSAA